MFSLEGKAALVTGASSGIGFAVARRLHAAGARVAGADIQGSDQLTGLGIPLFRVDVSNEADVAKEFARASERLDGLDILVNNAGVAGATASLAEHPIEDLHKTVAVNLFGVLWGLRHGPPLMRDGGSIINTASIAGLTASPGFGIYAMTKAAVISLTGTSAHELGPRGIRVNAVCPGTVITPMEPADGDEAQIAPLVTALGRSATVDDLAGVYHFLASDESRYVTGQVLPVDGGWSAGWSQRAWDVLVAAGRASSNAAAAD
jgi:NAD(P)-dependent dehydrogenase (short-subunit alcohol dehydrogenase family)